MGLAKRRHPDEPACRGRNIWWSTNGDNPDIVELAIDKNGLGATFRPPRTLMDGPNTRIGRPVLIARRRPDEDLRAVYLRVERVYKAVSRRAPRRVSSLRSDLFSFERRLRLGARPAGPVTRSPGGWPSSSLSAIGTDGQPIPLVGQPVDEWRRHDSAHYRHAFVAGANLSADGSCQHGIRATRVRRPGHRAADRDPQPAVARAVPDHKFGTPQSASVRGRGLSYAPS